MDNKRLENEHEVDRICTKCFTAKPLTNFYFDKTGKYGRGYFCKVCANVSARTNHRKRIASDPSYKAYKKDKYIKNRHGITLHEYEEKLASQNFECAICKVKLPTSGPYTHLDHDHKTGKLRDFLCTNCNRGLGHFQDSQKLLVKAAQYLNTHNDSGTVVKEVFVDDCSH